MIQLNPDAVMLAMVFAGIFFLVISWSDRQASRGNGRHLRHRRRPAH